MIHRNTLLDALITAAPACMAWRAAHGGSVLDVRELRNFAEEWDREKPLEGGASYVITREGAIGLTRSYEHLAEWLFLPLEGEELAQAMQELRDELLREGDAMKSRVQPSAPKAETPGFPMPQKTDAPPVSVPAQPAAGGEAATPAPVLEMPPEAPAVPRAPETPAVFSMPEPPVLRMPGEAAEAKLPETAAPRSPAASGGEGLCPRCGKPVNPGFKFCMSCGAPLAAAPAANRGAFCMNCGAPMKPGDRFCMKCGTPAAR